PAPGAGSVYSVAFDPRDPRSLYAGTAAGLAHSSDGGQSWKPAQTGSPGGIFALAFSGGAHEKLFAGASGALVSSDPESPRWTTFDLPAVMGLATDPSNPAVLYAGGRGRIFRTTDSGGDWSEISGEITSFVLDLAVDPKDAGTVYAGTAGSGVFKSRNQGKSWNPSGAELQNTAVRCLALDPGRSGTLYAGTDGGVFASTNHGGSWKLAAAGLPRAVAYALVIDPKKDRIFAGTASGLFVSETAGRSWKRFTSVEIPITSLAIDRDGEKLAAGTLGEGVLVFRVADLESQMEKLRAGSLQALPAPPEAIVPAPADGPEAPLEAEVNGARRAKGTVSARLDAAVQLDSVRDALAEKGHARLRLIVAADSPTLSRVEAGGL